MCEFRKLLSASGTAQRIFVMEVGKAVADSPANLHHKKFFVLCSNAKDNLHTESSKKQKRGCVETSFVRVFPKEKAATPEAMRKGSRPGTFW